MPADDASFEHFVADCADRLLLSAVLLVGGDWAAGEDLLQGAFERTYRHWGQMNDPKPEAYVRRALVNAATSRWRRLRARVSEVPLLVNGKWTADPADSSAADPAVVARVAEGLTLVGQPPPPVPPDETTAEAIRAAFHDAFTAGVRDDRFAAAVQDGPALASLRAKVAARYPRFAATLSVQIDQMLVVAPGTVSAGLWVSFTDPTVPPQALLAARSPSGAFGEAVLTPAGWQVTRAAYCDLVMGLGTPDLRCPP